ncbi:hypothetical protein LSAT2_009333 [Lamellibrachia satsuma]|nr:hypothetical protein LSAT2_009333 [Lamellibrachia satsuma]
MENIRRQFVGSVCRVDIIFDVYRPDSLKTTTRRERGKGTRRRVEGRNKLHANWPEFLRENDNKTELFHQLSERVTAETFPGKVVITHGDEEGREIKKIPPTQDALVQHLLQLGYQAGHVWGQALLKAPHLLSPADFGWTQKGDVPEWKVQWITLPPAASILCGSPEGFTRAKRMRTRVMKEWQSLGFDAVISPGYGFPALPLDTILDAWGAVSYTAMYNMLNFTAGSIPITKVTEEDLRNMKDYATPDPWHAVPKKNMPGSVGLPVNVQVVTLPWRDELCLRVMKDLQEALKEQST